MLTQSLCDTGRVNAARNDAMMIYDIDKVVVQCSKAVDLTLSIRRIGATVMCRRESREQRTQNPDFATRFHVHMFQIDLTTISTLVSMKLFR